MYPKKPHKSLIGDIGGTNIRLMIIEFERDSNEFKTI
jgi:glucokinase